MDDLESDTFNMRAWSSHGSISTWASWKHVFHVNVATIKGLSEGGFVAWLLFSSNNMTKQQQNSRTGRIFDIFIPISLPLGEWADTCHDQITLMF